MIKDSYDNHIKEALFEVNNGRNLGFINILYRTKEVCLDAVKFEATYILELNNFRNVPVGNLDYVTNHMREMMINNPEYLKILNEVYLEKKKRQRLEEYYFELKTQQETFADYKVDNYDDILHKIYDINIAKVIF